MKTESKSKTDQKETETIYRNKDFTGNTIALNSYLSKVILNVNGLNAPIKRYRVSHWIKKQDPLICYLQEIHIRSKDTSRLTARGGEQFIMLMGFKRQLE